MSVNKTSVAFLLYVNRNKIVVKTLHFNLCLMFDLLVVIYKCSSFHVFFVSGKADVVIHYHHTL